MSIAYLILENGTVFEGKSFGTVGDVIGETVFTTGMTGYLETLTDKSYFGQIIVQTFPLIGNYGVISRDFEGASVACRGYIVHNWCEEPSNFRSEGDLDTFLKAQNIVGLYGIDTRALTKIIRESGVMNGKISRTPDFDSKISLYCVKDALKAVSCKNIEYDNDITSGTAKYKVALLDFGIKENIRRELKKRGCSVTVFPYDTPASVITDFSPDGIMLSNGPGDPAENVGVIDNLSQLTKTGIPMFGICLGHQLLALANGFKTAKLKYGHRGANQPAKDLISGRTYITSQNHGYAVVRESVDKEVARESFINVNDSTSEGLIYNKIPVFSVQFHPEACGGPHDTVFLFDKFIDMIDSYLHGRNV